jgi:hypothetical protein
MLYNGDHFHVGYVPVPIRQAGLLHGGKVKWWFQLSDRQTEMHISQTVAKKFWKVAPSICGPSVWNMLHVTILAPRILKLTLEVRKICARYTCTHTVFRKRCIQLQDVIIWVILSKKLYMNTYPITDRYVDKNTLMHVHSHNQKILKYVFFIKCTCKNILFFRLQQKRTISINS